MTAMKLTGILAIAITVTAGAAFAQNPDAIDNARSIAKSLQQKQANDTNAALDAAGVTTAPSKPAPGAPAPAVKPATIPGSKPVAVAAAKPAAAPAKAAAPKAADSSENNQLQRVNVVQAADGVKVEIVSTGSVTPKLTKMSSPARVLIELPETVVATSQNKIPFGSAGVKGVRIGMDGKNPPTTSVVVDLEKALAFDLAPSAEGKIVLTLHTDGAAPAVAKNSPAPAKATAAQPKTVAATQSKPAELKPAVAKSADAPKVASVKDSKPAKAAAEPKQQAKSEKVAAPAAKPAAAAPAAEAAKAADSKPKQEDKKWAMSGKRDPFFSPVVQQNGSGCSTGKKCLEIGNINLRGVVKSDAGFIAVVTNNLNKAYFLRENDPVFNGYVVKITGDSVVFQETIQDKLGKPFTREVVKRIFTPAV
jgi:Tfp pilus assembly protein PilP